MSSAWDIQEDGSLHAFNVEDANRYGVEAAVLLRNIKFWTAYNFANGRNIHEDRPWTYNTQESYAKLFPYWNKEKVRRLLEKLVAQGALIKGNFNKSSMDRTCWYSPADYEMAISTFRLGKSDAAIPVSKPDHVMGEFKKHTKKENQPFQQFWDSYGKKTDRWKCESKWTRLSNEEQLAILEHVPRYVKSTPDPKYRKNPLTYLNGKCWQDEVLVADEEDFYDPTM
jgi:hypothetical protein